jgi:hypothetical protein
MKLSRLNRRDFIEAMLVAGLAACGGGRALRSSRSAHGATGSLFGHLARLADQLVAGAITPRDFVARGGERLLELELELDVLAEWEERGPDIPGEGRNGYRVIHTRRLPFRGRAGAMKAVLFYTPAWTSNPPHEHHNLMSVKRVLVGSYHVREYERLQRLAPGAIAIRQVSERPAVSFDGPCVEMTDDRKAVHWFGAGDRPVLALNIVVEDALAPEATFHGAGETRPTGRYFVDPTAEPDLDGVIVARAIEGDRAQAFSQRPLSAYPSRLRAT